MEQLEDLFIQNFNVSSETLVDKSNGQPINAWKFEDGLSTPFFETPEFVGYVDSALYHLTEEFTELCICDGDATGLYQALDELVSSQISKRISEVFDENISVKMEDHIEKLYQETRDKERSVHMRAKKLLKPLLKEFELNSLNITLNWDRIENHNLKEDDPIIPAIHFSYGYRDGWDTFRVRYNDVRVLDHKGFADKIIENYFSEPDRSLPFMYPDLVLRFSELED